MSNQPRKTNPMTEAKHTPEPIYDTRRLRLSGEGHVRCRILKVDGGYCETVVEVWGLNEERDALAKRLVDCWNACEGINPDAVPDLLTACRAAISAMTDTRSQSCNQYVDATEEIEAAISKAEGGAG